MADARNATTVVATEIKGSNTSSLGKFAAKITIPVDVKPGVYMIDVQVVDDKKAVIYEGSPSITVADPRPPSGELAFGFGPNTTVFRPAENKVMLSVAANTMLGTPVDGAVIDVEWVVAG